MDRRRAMRLQAGLSVGGKRVSGSAAPHGHAPRLEPPPPANPLPAVEVKVN